MNHFKIYFSLFIDSLINNLVISLNNELFIHSMPMFNTYNNSLMLILSTSASMVAISINYLLGRILLNIFYYTKNQQSLLRYQHFSKFYFKYKIILLSLIIEPFLGRFIPLTAGFTKIKFSIVLIVSSIIKLCYYIYILYFSS